MALQRRMLAEFLGTAGLLMAVVGSGIMAERLSAGNAAVALLANSVATGAALVALILTFGPISGAHLNPVVTVSDAFQGGVAWKDVPWYFAGHGAGALTGVLAAHLMFGLPAFFVSRHVRSGTSQMLGETIATAGLLLVILLCSRVQPQAVPYAVAAYITGAYWFTSSTSFANPAVTLARSLTDTFAGIRPTDVPGFLLGETAGTVVAIALSRLLLPEKISAGNAASQ
jgi:glycerol uptake facilitator-like aquaporin